MEIKERKRKIKRKSQKGEKRREKKERKKDKHKERKKKTITNINSSSLTKKTEGKEREFRSA